jgi:hypothetical protein
MYRLPIQKPMYRLPIGGNQTLPHIKAMGSCVSVEIERRARNLTTIREYYPPVRLSLSARLINRGTVFFSYSKSATAGL